jgi:hypothetical protein
VSPGPVKTPHRELCNLQTSFQVAPILRTSTMSRTRERWGGRSIDEPERTRSRSDSWYAKCSLHTDRYLARGAARRAAGGVRGGAFR